MATTVADLRKWLDQFSDDTLVQVCMGPPGEPDFQPVNQQYAHYRDGSGWGYWKEENLLVIGEID